jgi:hypothetical protein
MRYARARSIAPQGYYEWPAPGRPFSIQLSLGVMDRIEADIREDLREARGRPVETGGILFGHLEGGGKALYIEGYRRVRCEHRHGLSYRLSGADQRRLEHALRRGQVAGFYRSHTRPGLYLDQDDYALIENYFSNPHDVFLLVRPNAEGSATGGFFFWEEDSIHRHSTYLEFPFHSSEARPTIAPPRPPAQPPLRRARRMMALPQVAGAAVGLGLAGLFVAYRTPAPPAPKAGIGLTADAAPALWVARNGSDLQVSWDGNAPSVAVARDGILRITDGDLHKDLRLDQAQLRQATLTYAPLNNDVTFRLDLAGGAFAVSEHFRLRESRRPPAPAVRAQASEPKPPSRRRVWFDDGL